MNEPPGMHGQEQQPIPSQKLILPAYDSEAAVPDYHTYRGPMLSQQMGHYQSVPTPVVPPPIITPPPPEPRVPPPALRPSSWRNDPAYKVLFIALGLVVAAGIVLALFIASLFSQSAPSSKTREPTTLAPVATQQETVDVNPTFVVPTPTAGSPTGSQAATPTPAPTPIPTPTLEPTPTFTPTPTPVQNGSLSLQITGYPSQVRNNEDIPIEVTASEGGLSVVLTIKYDVPPHVSSAGPQVTNSGGHTTFNWRVFVTMHSTASTNAYLTATGYDQNGKKVVSQTISVLIVSEENN